MKKNYLMLIVCITFLHFGIMGCGDNDSNDSVGEPPLVVLDEENIVAAPGSEFVITGTFTDKEGVASVILECPALFLSETIDLIKLHGAPQKTYKLDFSYSLREDEAEKDFTVKVTVKDVDGHSVSQNVKITVQPVDIVPPTIVFTSDVEHEITADTKYTFGFYVKDDSALDYVTAAIPGVFEEMRIGVGGKSECKYSTSLTFINKSKEYNVTVTAVDMSGNSSSATCVLKVKEVHVKDS